MLSFLLSLKNKFVALVAKFPLLTSYAAGAVGGLSFAHWKTSTVGLVSVAITLAAVYGVRAAVKSLQA